MLDDSRSHSLSTRSSRFGCRLVKYGISIALVLSVSTGCTRLHSRLFKQPANADFTIQVNEQLPGTYAIAGNTNLPDKSQIAIAAVRYLYPADSGSQLLKPNPTYSILAYQSVAVKQGKWSATLNLWQVAPNGQFQEAWQLDKTRLKLSVQPAKEVVFLATLVPEGQVDQLQTLAHQLAKRNLKLDHRLVRATVDGQQYLQVSQTQAIALPTGSTLPPTARLDEMNGGWGDRFVIPQESQNPYKLEFPSTRKTNASASPKEFLR